MKQSEKGAVKRYRHSFKLHGLLLILTLFITSLLAPAYAQNLPVLGDNFTGGIAVHGQPHQSQALLTLNNPVEVTGNITVAPAHVGKTADIFVYVEAILPPATDVLYFMLGEGLKTIAVWDKNPANLIPFQPNVTLSATQPVVMYTGPFVYLGTFKVFFGYRLPDGTMVASTTPITIITSNKGEPHFPGLVSLTPTDTDKMTLAWLPAQDDNTPLAAMTYQVHLSDQPTFTPSTATLHTTVTGQEKTEVTGLAAGKTYNVLVVAVDQDGNESMERDYRTATTFAEPVIVSQTTQFAEDKNLGLGTATTSDGVQFTYPSGGTPPQVGSVLFANVGENMYLRKVDSVTPTAGSTVVQTSDAELANVIEQGTIDNEVTLFDVEEAATRANQEAGIKTTRSLRADGGRYSEMRWEENSLVAEQIDYTEERKIRAGEDEAGKTDEEAPFKVEPTLKFRPSLDVRTSWQRDPSNILPVLTSGHVIARGTFSVEMKFTYNFGSAGSFKKEIPIFSRDFTQRYLVGGIPIFQETTLALKAVLKASAVSGIKASATTSASAGIEIGARFNPSTGNWEAIPMSPDFKLSLDKAGIDLGGIVEGEVRLVPSITVIFYGVVGPELSIEPFVKGKVVVAPLPDIVAELGYLPMQPTKFDVSFQAESKVGISLKIFGKFRDLPKVQVWESPEVPLFSLPELKISGGSGKVGDSISLTVTTKDGTHNPFNESSIRWNAYPNKGTISGGKTGTFVPTEEGSYTVFFSGHSRLPDPLGRQFAKAEVSVGKKDDKPKGGHGISGRCHSIGNNSHGIASQCNSAPLGESGSYDDKKRKQGVWTYVHNDGSFDQNTYVNGIWNGPSGQWKADGSPTGGHGNYVNGNKDGIWTYIYDSGNYDTNTYVNGIWNGPSGQWKADCSPTGGHGNYVNGNKDGVWTYIYDSGNYDTNIYVNGIWNGPLGQWKADGSPTGEHGNYVNGNKDGVWTYYCGNGKTTTSTYANGVFKGSAGSC